MVFIDGLSALATTAGFPINVETFPVVIGAYARLPGFHGFGFARTDEPLNKVLPGAVDTYLHVEARYGRTVLLGTRPRTNPYILDWPEGTDRYSLVPVREARGPVCLPPFTLRPARYPSDSVPGSLGMRSSRARRSTPWHRAVRRFEQADFESDLIGDAWRHRILYEVGRTPALLQRAGLPRPIRGPGSVRSAHLKLLKSGLPFAPATLSTHLVALRRFLRWSGNPLAQDRAAWAIPSGTPSRRRWLSQEQLVRLYQASRGTERALVALEGFNGLRRVEVLRLRYRDVDVAANRLRVLGKGRHGGKWRTVPLAAEAARALARLPSSPLSSSFLIPLSRSGADLALQRAARRAGFPEQEIRVSHHDLRRTFGRLAHKAGMDLVQLKNLYGHSSLDQTVHYIGLDEDEMRVGLDRLTSMIAPSLERRRAGARPSAPTP